MAPSSSALELTAWAAQPGTQQAFIACPIYERLYGGARGGAKTETMIGDWLVHSFRWGGQAKGVFFRRHLTELEEVIARTHEIYPLVGAHWRGQSKTWVMPNAARLKMRYLERDDDAAMYQGHNYSWLTFEELTNWAFPDAINKLRATLRSRHGIPVRWNATANPGGPGHFWVKARYIDPAPGGWVPIVDPRTGKERIFIPSRLEDNLLLHRNDPDYEMRLLDVSHNSALVRAWRYGIWDEISGGFFSDVWNPLLSVLEPFDIPQSWLLGRSFDWGSARPASLGMWAISDGTPILRGKMRGRVFPRGSIIRFDEMYFAAKDDSGQVIPNQGVRMGNDELGAAIAKRCSDREWRWSICDPSIFTEDGGPSIYDQMSKGARSINGHKLRFVAADNSRAPGWSLLRTLMKNAGHKELPALYVTSNCTQFLRTVPVLAMDESRPDDLDTSSEDHIADEARYFCMAMGLNVASLSAGDGPKRITSII